RNRAPAHDWHGGVRRRVSDLADGTVDSPGRADLYVGHLGRARFRRTYRGRHPDPPCGAHLHEPFRRHSAPQIRAAVVEFRFLWEPLMLKMPTLDVHSSVADTRTDTKVAATDVNVFYGEKQALQNVSVNIPDR